jgi:hypothetical protein
MLINTLPVTAAGRNVMAPVSVQPFLFQVKQQPEVTVEQSEIDSFIWLPVKEFQDRNRHEIREALPGRFRPVFPLEDYYIWGFTYGLLCFILNVKSTGFGESISEDL